MPASLLPCLPACHALHGVLPSFPPVPSMPPSPCLVLLLPALPHAVATVDGSLLPFPSAHACPSHMPYPGGYPMPACLSPCLTSLALPSACHACHHPSVLPYPKLVADHVWCDSFFFLQLQNISFPCHATLCLPTSLVPPHPLP